MQEQQKDTIKLCSGCYYAAEDLKEELRQVRAVIVTLLGEADDVQDTKGLARALYTLQYLTEDAQIIDEK